MDEYIEPTVSKVKPIYSTAKGQSTTSVAPPTIIPTVTNVVPVPTKPLVPTVVTPSVVAPVLPVAPKVPIT